MDDLEQISGGLMRLCVTHPASRGYLCPVGQVVHMIWFGFEDWYKNKIKILEGMEELYHIGPFYHSRLTDEGPRKWAKPIPININNK